MQDKEIKVLEDTLEKGFHKEEGPFVKGLDCALASFNVQRQAYYAGTLWIIMYIEPSRYVYHFFFYLVRKIRYLHTCSCATLTHYVIQSPT